MATMKKQKAAPRSASGGERERTNQQIITRVSNETADWIQELVTRYGLRAAEITRRILEDAKTDGWNPVDSMARSQQK